MTDWERRDRVIAVVKGKWRRRDTWSDAQVVWCCGAVYALGSRFGSGPDLTRLELR